MNTYEEQTDKDTAMEMVLQAPREIPVRGEYDVIVCGGGLGGTAAAVAAGRTGARTLLIERNSFLGGVATAGMCCSIFNCYYTSEGQLGTTGIAVEVADKLAESMGYGRKWHKHKGHIIYDIERGKQVLQDLVVDAGAELLLQACVAGAVVSDGALDGVVVETKSGPQAIRAKVVVDATGDSDVAARAGARVRVIEKGVHSLCFRLGNVDVDMFVDYFREHPEQFPEYMDVDWTLPEALAQYDECGTFLFPHGGGMQMDAFKQAKANGDLPSSIGIQDTTDACQMHALRQTGIVHVITGFTHFNGLDPELISRSITDGRHMAFTVADVYRKYLPGFADAFVAGTAANLGVRTSRCLDGDVVFTADMMQAGVRQPDAVGRAVGWDHLVKHPGPKAWGVQACREAPFDLPYGCLLPREVDGLLMGAGRSISTNNPSLLRVMVHTMVVGQGAGTAAAVAAKTGATPRQVDLGVVQNELRRQGVDLD
ncbi:MAG: FAD-dependent oxidoreductase [Lentisphaerae bacterium]|jgi:ribulose 1,5-bisphosphate synthetase/thiazole synthase|nr:FAD-dependent oxidoreductase [Lentisphaerota bacterium]MBT5611289.1 FAD-dependent oxidoreductase [Lentisphaerota bacterium]MBT7058394.1 FAD-dependent oxidoreductase [Lentisphaerota bacterium]MBT7846829.1 FAD-dependent oxidoreductase [Lentisphaerota bacterium]